MMFQVGDRVRIIPGTRYYSRCDLSNPADIEGVVKSIEHHESWPISVIWDNGSDNVYDEEDLEHALPAKPIEEFL